MTNTEQRRQKLRRLVKKANVDGILVTNFTNVTYLTGFSGDDSFLLVTRDKDILLSDPRYTEQLQEECPGLELAIRSPGVKMAAFLGKVIRESKTKQLAIESLSMTVSMCNFLQETLTTVELVPTEGLVEQLREIKEKSENRCDPRCCRYCPTGILCDSCFVTRWSARKRGRPRDRATDSMVWGFGLQLSTHRGRRTTRRLAPRGPGRPGNR